MDTEKVKTIPPPTIHTPRHKLAPKLNHVESKQASIFLTLRNPNFLMGSKLTELRDK
jgi:hypothetical protein